MALTLKKTPDFGGWATKANIVCADGLTIGHDAFKDMDGLKVPLVYNHGHSEPGNILGHALLEHRNEGVYAYCYFNGSDNAQTMSHAVEHDDLTMMSIYANRLRKDRETVIHGVIREVSLVMAGANPEALIDFVSIKHGDDYELLETDAIITTGLSITHGDMDNVETDEEDHDATWASMSPKQQALTQLLLQTVADNAAADPEDDASDKEADPTDAEPTDADADPAPAESVDATDPAEAPADADAAPATDAGPAQHSALTNDDLKGSDMTETLTHNVFDQAAALEHGLMGKAKDGQYVLSHADKESIFATALSQRSASLKDVVNEFKLQHGIDNIEILFPDAKAVSNTPDWVKRRTEWVDRVLGGTKHTPFSRIKSLSADLTLEQARAKGYIKGALKKEEFFAVAKRTTSPQTIYKKQKLDRDDILDITDFDVVVWLKGEMRIMLDEEIARAVLIGDGRSNADDDKILEDKIRPIATDHELFQTTVRINLGNTNSSAEEIVDAILLNRRYYKGSGNPDLFTTEIIISQILNVKDTTGRRIYQSLQDLATTLRVASIIPVEVMEDQPDLVAIMVNLMDYTIGTDRGGDISMFDQFDIDYNQYKYLIETRCSGALTKPKSALVIRRAADDATVVTPVAPTWSQTNRSVTVATTTGLVYKNRDNGAILTTAQPVVLTDGQEMTVIAVPTNSTYYIESSELDEFSFSFAEGPVDGPF